MNRKLINRLGIPYVLGKCYPKTLPSIFDSFSSVVPSSYPVIKKVVEYNVGNEIFCELPPARSHRFGTNSLSFRGSILWNSLSDDVKTPQNLAIFKQKIKSWNGTHCKCNICRNYLLVYLFSFNSPQLLSMQIKLLISSFCSGMLALISFQNYFINIPTINKLKK